MPLDAKTNHVEVGPLSNQKHAEEVAAKYVAEHPHCHWTGQWKTTAPGKMSIIEVRHFSLNKHKALNSKSYF